MPLILATLISSSSRAHAFEDRHAGSLLQARELSVDKPRGPRMTASDANAPTCEEVTHQHGNSLRRVIVEPTLLKEIDHLPIEDAGHGDK
jgi:hypothetical protein